MTRSSLVVIGVALALLGSTLTGPADEASGTFSSTTSSAGSLTAATLAPPTGLQVSFHCELLGILKPVADLSWTASGSSYASGYSLDRYKGLTLNLTAPISGLATNSFTDGEITINLSLSTTYTWHLRSTFNSWVSADAVVTATTPAICL